MKLVFSASQASSINVSVPPLLNCTYLSSTIDPGDVIEYKLNRPINDNDNDDCIIRATVAGIRLELDGKTKTVLLNNGDALVNSLHLVRRISMRNLYTGEIMWNPIRDWVALSSIHKHPTEDAADGPGKILLIDADDEDRQRCGNTADLFDPEMTDPSKIQQDYAMDFAEDYRVHENEGKNSSASE